MDVITPHCQINFAGTVLDSWQDDSYLVGASIDLASDKSGEATFSVVDPNFEFLDRFLTASKRLSAKFWLGWGRELGNEFFDGVLIGVSHSGGISEFRFHDKSVNLKGQKKARYHKKKSDIQILRELAAENDLQFSLNSKQSESEKFDDLVQRGKTDWEFAKEVAARAGLRLYVRGNTLFAVDAGTTQVFDAVQTLAFGRDFEILQGFSLNYKLPESRKGRPKKTVVRGRSAGAAQLSAETVTGERGTADILISDDLPKHTLALAEKQAKAATNKRREYAFEHQLRTLPSMRVRLDVRNTVTLAEMGKFFSGNYIVTDIRYEFAPGALTAEMTVGRDIA